MGVLDEAIREHLDLKRQHGAAEDELARQEAEALGPARRPAEHGEPLADADATSAIDPAELGLVEAGPESDEPDPIPPSLGPEPDVPDPPRVAPVHDIDEDPLAPPPPVTGAQVDEPPIDEGA